MKRASSKVAVAVLVAWLTSMSGFVRHYGSSMAWVLDQGWAGVYWRGDPELRKSYLYNGGNWPLHGDNRFAGMEPPQSSWEVYGPDIVLWDLRHEIMEEPAAFFGHLGFGLPDVRISKEAACVVLPLGPAGAAAIFVLGWLFVGRRRDIRSGYCLICGYDLRASDERCPECGTAVAAGVK